MPRYDATLTGGALMLSDSRRIAALMLQRPSAQAWSYAIRVDNLLQKRTASTAWRQARLIRQRLERLPPALWPLVAQGSVELGTQTLLAATVRHSALLSDFMADVLRSHHRRLETALSPRAWPIFMDECAARDATAAAWSEGTRRRLGQVVLRILVEARYLEARSLRLRPPHLHPELTALLKAEGVRDVINTLELHG
ncbi:MAG: hypothetical protein RL223_4230 [Pseudomonadota bacterium]